MEAFMRLAAMAHGQPEDARSESVGAGEQAAAIHLVGDLGREDPHLTAATYALFDSMETWLPPIDTEVSRQLLAAIQSAKQFLPPRRRQEPPRPS
jgi:hypothetical protein